LWVLEIVPVPSFRELEFYRDNGRKNQEEKPLGLMHLDIGATSHGTIQVAAAFDIDKRKVGKPLKEAVFAKPNCTRSSTPTVNDSGVRVSMGEVLDGVSEHMKDYPEDRIFMVADQKPDRRGKVLRSRC